MPSKSFFFLRAENEPVLSQGDAVCYKYNIVVANN